MTIQELAIDYLETRSEKSFSLLYKRLYPNLRNYTKNFLTSYCKANLSDNIDDIISTVWFKVINNINDYNKIWNFSTWVYAICKNELLHEKQNIFKFVHLDNLNSEDSENKISQENWLSTYAVNKEDVYIDEIDIEQREKTDEINKLYKMTLNAILNLPEEYKSIIIDREIYHMKYKEISEKYDMNIDTVKSRIKLGRSKIKDKIIKEVKDKNMNYISINKNTKKVSLLL